MNRWRQKMYRKVTLICMPQYMALYICQIVLLKFSAPFFYISKNALKIKSVSIKKVGEDALK
jgi:hypothetical protein